MSMSTVSDHSADTPATGAAGTVEEIVSPDKPEGPIAAAILAAGVGSLAMGVVTTLVEMSIGIKDALTWSTDVGPLSGKTGIAVIVWLMAWGMLHAFYRRKPAETTPALAVALALVALGVLGTFPTVFQAFAE
jgi:hypothetical protein